MSYGAHCNGAYVWASWAYSWQNPESVGPPKLRDTGLCAGLVPAPDGSSWRIEVVLARRWTLPYPGRVGVPKTAC